MTWMSSRRTPRHAFRAALAACLSLIPVAAALGQAILIEEASPTPPAAPAEPLATGQPVGDLATILEPSQGRPLILQPGEQFRFLMRLGDGVSGDVLLELHHTQAKSIMIALKSQGDMTLFQQRYASVVMTLPPKLPTGLYDLVLRSGNGSLTSPRSVHIVDAFKNRFRFVHLSDMTIGDPSAPAFDDRLVEEINLLAPAFILATGDFTAWGRLLDDDQTWAKALTFFARFNSPVYMVCGDLDHQPSFVKHVAQSPVGTFDYGGYHGVLLLDHAYQPIDDLQLDFLRRDLDAHRGNVFNILVTHDDSLGFLKRLAPASVLKEYLADRRVRMIVTGGSDDWDRKENAALIDKLDVAYIRTHQASTALRGRATGVSHYRVIEVDGENFTYVYPADDATSIVSHSIPVGRVRAFIEGEETGRVIANVQNALNQSFADARIWLRVARAGPREPQVAGGRLVQALPDGNHWTCEIAMDLPDKGGVRVIAKTDGPIQAPVPLTARLTGESDLVFTPATTDAGLVYFESSQPLRVILDNPTDQAIRAFPTLRLNGKLLSLASPTTWPVEIKAGEHAVLEPRLLLGRVSPGPHLLQLTYMDDPVRRVTMFPVTMRLE